MTLPDERTRAVLQTRKFLRRLLNSKETPRVPKTIREEAHRLLKHYPGELDLDHAAKSAPKVFDKPKREKE